MFKTAWNVLRTAKRWIFSSKRDIHVQAAKDNVVALLDDDPKLVTLVDPMDFGTPLHWAAIYGQVSSCKTLITRGADLEAMERLVAEPSTDLFAPIPHGDGQTILREALLVADHNAYHIGQLVMLRKMLGAWPA